MILIRVSKKIRSMRIRAFLLTFLAYAVMHSLRTSYSSSKTYFKVEYNFSSTFLAVLDSSIYLAMGVGFFLRYLFLNNKDIIFSFLITGIIFIVSFSLFPLLSLAGFLNDDNAAPISITLMLLFGFFQMNCWPVSLIIVSDYFTNEEDGGTIGFWTTAGNIGNILGYLIPALLILDLHQPWQVPDLILAMILLLCTAGVYIFVKRKRQLTEEGYLQLENEAQQSQQEREISFDDLLTSFSEMFSTVETGLLVINACIYKAIIYTLLLWLPILIDSMGQKSHSAYISIIFNIANTIGAFVIGKFYQSSPKSNSYAYLQYINPALSLVLIGGMIALVKLETYSFMAYACIIFIEGFITGGIFNCLSANQLLKLSGSNSVKLDLYTTIFFAMSTFTVGVAQLMVGCFMVEASKPISEQLLQEGAQAESYGGVFTVLLILAGLGLITMSIRSYNISRNLNSMVNSQ